MNKLYKRIKPLISISVLIGLITFFLTFLTTFYMNYDNLSIVEISLLPLIGGFFFFFSLTFIGVNQLNKINIENDFVLINRYYQVLIILVISFATYLLADSLIFIFDKSLSENYSQGLINLTEEMDNNEIQEFEKFGKLPFGIQNFVLTLIAGIVSYITILIGMKKKNGYQHR